MRPIAQKKFLGTLSRGRDLLIEVTFDETLSMPHCGLATAVTLACKDIKISSEISKHISNNNFRCYISDDIIGAQIGGALKNVFAIACGAAAGYNLGESAKASLITRSFAEIRRIGLKLGGRRRSGKVSEHVKDQ